MSKSSKQSHFRPLVGLMTHTPYKNLPIEMVPPKVQRLWKICMDRNQTVDLEFLEGPTVRLFRLYGLLPPKRSLTSMMTPEQRAQSKREYDRRYYENTIKPRRERLRELLRAADESKRQEQPQDVKEQQ
jgi:hypothetical protein